MAVHGDQCPHEPHFDERRVRLVRGIVPEKLHLALLLPQNPAREIGGDADDARGGLAVGRVQEPHVLRTQFIEKDLAEKIRVRVFDQHGRRAIVRFAGTVIGKAHEIHKRQRHHEQPHVRALVLEKEPQVRVPDVEDSFHSWERRRHAGRVTLDSRE